MAVVRHLVFLKCIFKQPTKSTWWSLSLCNFGLNRCSSFDSPKVWIFCVFGLKNTYWCQNVGFWSIWPLKWGMIWMQPTKGTNGCWDSDFSFLRWSPSPILDLLGTYWDDPQIVFDGLYYCANRSLNCFSSFDGTKVWIFACLKTPIYAPKMWVWVHLTSKMWGNINAIPIGTSLCSNTSYDI